MLIRDLLAAGTPSISFEFFPPKTEEAAAQLERTIEELAPLRPTFVSVTYGAGGSTREKTIDIVSRIKRVSGIESMAHLTCVGATREELEAILHRLVDAGVENILALRGDPPKGQATFTAVEGGFRYADELVGLIRRVLPTGVSVGGAAYPEKHVECSTAAADIENLKRKVDAGVDFLITQLVLDNRHYWDFRDRAEAAGIKVPIIPGIMPISNPASAQRFGASLPASLAAGLARHDGNPHAQTRLGIAHATSQCIDLMVGGAPGLHFFTLNRSSATRDIFAALKLIGLIETGGVESGKPTA